MPAACNSSAPPDESAGNWDSRTTMNEPSVATPSGLAAASELIRQIESLWESGQNPDADALMTAAGVSSPGDVAKVLATDQWHRWHAGERLMVEGYFARHPAIGADAEAALILVYGEFLVREERGERPSAGEYLKRFPRCAAGLRRQLDFHAAIEEPDSTASASEKATGEGMAPTPFSTDATALPPPDSARLSATGPAEAGAPTSLGSPVANAARLSATGPAEAGTPTRSGSPDPNDARLTPSGPQTHPALIGRYRIIRRLGQGGFGRVYLGATTSWTGQSRSKCPTSRRSPGIRMSRGILPRQGWSPSSTIPRSSRFMTWAGPTTASATSCRSSSREATWASGCGRCGWTSVSRRSWWQRSRSRCITPTLEAWSTATSSRPISCSTSRIGRASPTSGWR